MARKALKLEGCYPILFSDSESDESKTESILHFAREIMRAKKKNLIRKEIKARNGTPWTRQDRIGIILLFSLNQLNVLAYL